MYIYGTIYNPSDERDKKDIVSLEPNTGIEFINKLNPVNFIWNMRDGGKVDIPEQGFIAQQLRQAQNDTNFIIPNLVNDKNPEKLYASYGTLIPVMVQAIKDLKAEIDILKQEISYLKSV